MKNVIILSLMCFGIAVLAQKVNPDWTFPIEGTPKSIFVHDLSGIPVVETSKFYYGVNFVDKSILWKVEKDFELSQNSKLIANAALGTNISETEDFFSVPYTSFVSINNIFLDIKTGKILFGADEDSTYSNILETDIIPEIFALLVKVKAKGGIFRLYCIDLNSKEVLWSKDLGKESTLKALSKVAGFGAFSTVNAFAPKATSTLDIVYKDDKKLFLLNGKTGDIIWENQCNPGTFFFDDKEQYLFVVAQAGGLGALVSSASFGKEVFSLDLKTGQNLWKKSIKLSGKYVNQIQIDDDKVLIASKDGINLYNYKTGEQSWKKDFETKNFKNVTVKDDGFEVFYGNKTMLVNKETGKGLWKKPFEIDIDDDDSDVLKIEYQKGFLVYGADYIGFYDKTKGKSIWKLSIDKTAKCAFDYKNDKVAVLDGKKFYLFNPDELVKKPEKIKLDVEKSGEIVLFETHDAGYFIQGLNEYFFLNKDASVAEHKYFKQLQTDRWSRGLLTVGSVAAGLMSSSVTAGDSQPAGLFSSHHEEYGNMSNEMSSTVNRLSEEAKLRGASKTTNDFAYFISGEKTDGQDVMSLVKIDKNSGKQVNIFDLGNDRKIIYEIAPSIDMAFVIIDGQLAAFNL
jgi:outer membrane protein assembly factor BamB